jgi:hypothetical protein
MNSCPVSPAKPGAALPIGWGGPGFRWRSILATLPCCIHMSCNQSNGNQMLKLGPKLFKLLNAKQLVGNRMPVIYGAKGLSSAEIASIDAQLGFRLPEDFAYLLQNIQDPGGVLFPWSSFEKQQYDNAIAWVLKGIEFDVEKSNLWLCRWSKRPTGLSSALDIVKRDFSTWPKLLPVYGHRFLAAEPCRCGNPVFSIMQTDIIYYGSDLSHYLVNEFIDHDYAYHTDAQKIRRIDVWSDFAENRF